MESHCHGLVKSLSTFTSYVNQRQLSCHCSQILKQTPANGFSLLPTTLKSGQLFVNVPASPIRSMTRRVKSRKTRLLRPVHLFVLFVSVRARRQFPLLRVWRSICASNTRNAVASKIMLMTLAFALVVVQILLRESELSPTCPLPVFPGAGAVLPYSMEKSCQKFTLPSSLSLIQGIVN